MLCDLIPMLEKYERPIYFCGDGYDLTVNEEIKNKMQTPEMLIYQSGYSVGKIAYRKIKNNEAGTDAELRVEYLRKAQAEREREEKLKKENENG